MDIQERRALLETDRNPDYKLDYVSSLRGRMTAHGPDGNSIVGLRYIPDRLILRPAAFARYLDALGSLEWASLEEAAAAVLNDVNNELVARWVQVFISAPEQAQAGVDRHEVLLEDRQPNWDNPGLLSRLERY